MAPKSSARWPLLPAECVEGIQSVLRGFFPCSSIVPPNRFVFRRSNRPDWLLVSSLSPGGKLVDRSTERKQFRLRRPTECQSVSTSVSSWACRPVWGGNERAKPGRREKRLVKFQSV